MLLNKIICKFIRMFISCVNATHIIFIHMYTLNPTYNTMKIEESWPCKGNPYNKWKGLLGTIGSMKSRGLEGQLKFEF